jgi:peptide deformylase
MHWYMLEWKGVGLAAPQVGRDIRMFVINTMVEVGGKKRTIINPEIIEAGDNISMKEGCLSFPEKFLELDRPSTIVLKYTDEDGIEKTEEFEGLTARAILHELDHLNGKVFIDYEKK